MDSKKQEFYIFLDFDGVLNDFKTIPHVAGFLFKKKDKDVFNRESIEALNCLIETLEHKFSVVLVLSTFWRKNLKKASELLYNHGLRYNGIILATPFASYKTRLFEIMEFIKKYKLNENYVVIDDIPKITQYFAEKNNIKTNIIDGALTMSSILNYIDTYHQNLSKKFPIDTAFDFEKNN